MAIPHRHFINILVLTSIDHKVIDKLLVVDSKVMDKHLDSIDIDCTSCLLQDIIIQGRLIDMAVVMPYIRLDIIIKGIVRDSMVIIEVIKLA